MKDSNEKDWHKIVPERLAIVGLGGSSLSYVQEVDSVGNRFSKFDEVWTMNSYCNVIQSDRLWHMDNVAVQRLRSDNVKVQGMLEAMKKYQGPIYTSILDKEYPQMVQFPLFEVIDKMGSIYYNNTSAYAIAYAVWLGVKQISLYGMDFTWPGLNEAEEGRGCVEYWIGQGSARGVRFNVVPTSSLMGAMKWRKEDIPFYGYDGYKIALVEKGEGKVGFEITPRALPTKEEIEKRYSHEVKRFDLEAVKKLFEEKRELVSV